MPVSESLPAATPALVATRPIMPGSTNFSAFVSTQVIKAPNVPEGDGLSPEKTVKYCDVALQVAESNEELHQATRIFNIVFNSATRTLKIHLKKRRSMAFEYPEDLKDLDLKDATNGDTNRKRLKEWKLEWLQKLRAAVAPDTVQIVLDAVSEIHLGAIPGTVLTAKQVLSYIGRISRLIDGLSESTFKEIKPKALNSAIMRKWPPAIRHLMEDTAKVDETWEDLLVRLSEF